MMGGAAGHLQNAWEASDLTFGDIRNLIHTSLTGTFDRPSEKLDGQNLLLTWKDYRVVVARTGKHLRDHGAQAIGLHEIWDFFGPKTPDSVRDAYKKAMEDFQTIFDSDPDGAKAIFWDGEFWMNAEILYEDTENVIHYGVNEIKIHEVFKVDPDGKKIDTVHRIKYWSLLSIARDSKHARHYRIDPIHELSFKKIKDVPEVEMKLNQNLDLLQWARGLTDDSTIEDYVVAGVEDYMMENMPVGSMALLPGFARRWGADDKSTNIRTLLKDADPDTSAWFRAEDANKFAKKLSLFPLIVFFLRLGVIVLKNLDGLATSDPAGSVEKIKEKAVAALDTISKIPPPNAQDIGLLKTINNLTYQLRLLEHIDKFNAITPTEGVVFTFNGRLLKLTGAFGPLLQLIAYSKYR